jgi:hypothetical protein
MTCCDGRFIALKFWAIQVESYVITIRVPRKQQFSQQSLISPYNHINFYNTVFIDQKHRHTSWLWNCNKFVSVKTKGKLLLGYFTFWNKQLNNVCKNAKYAYSVALRIFWSRTLQTVTSAVRVSRRRVSKTTEKQKSEM